MSRDTTPRASGGGPGFLGLLALLFIGLKLAGVIDWSWWWVTAPLWGGLVLLLVFLAFAWAWLAVDRRRRGRLAARRRADAARRGGVNPW